MSASRSPRSVRSSKKARAATAVAPPPWIDDDIDYGPANAAARELATWAFALAEHDAEDWPDARQRVRNARRYVLARLAGKDRYMPVEDVMFTASLLARILDDDLGLGLADSLSIFDTLDLPADLLPVPPRPTSPAASARPAVRAPNRIPPPLRLCDECGYVHEPGPHVGYRNAA